MTEVRTFAVGYDDDGIRLDRWFKRHLPETSFTTVAMWARTGQLRVDGSRAAPGDRLEAGQTLRVPPPEPIRPVATPERERVPLSDAETTMAREMVIHQDAQAFVLNKPPGLATQGGTKTTAHVDGLLDALRYDNEGRPKLVHRLDKDTSGALLIARTARAAAFFAKAFSGRTARKTYWALIVDVPSIEDGMIELPIGKQPGTGGEKMMVDEAEGSPARTRYRVIERAGNRTAWVELQPFTGRTHQLRVHMAAIGHPIVGDGKYGGAAAFLTGGISRKMHLHARRIRVDHPDGGEIDVQAELPTHFAESLKQLGFDEMLGNMMPMDEKVAPTKAEEKQRAKAHAKGVRKENRGERRRRGAGEVEPRAAAAAPKRARASAAKAKPTTGTGRGKLGDGGRPGRTSDGRPRTHAPASRGPRTPGGGGGAGGGAGGSGGSGGGEASLMHPNAIFRSDLDPLAFAAATGFAHIVAVTAAGPMAVHGPVTRHDDTLRFHVARGNRIANHVDGAAVLISIVGPHGYISPNWYAVPGDQVPTWNYVAVEIDGRASAVDDDLLVDHLDTLAAVHEPRPRPWTRDKMDDGVFRKMLGGIRGFSVAVAATRTTDKRSQNKSGVDRAGVIAGLDRVGNDTMAAAMRA